jgi:uncharacterized protein
MSAANSSYDLDALHRAQRAYEPSMEEILASIRNIISEDRPGPTPAPAASAPQPAAFSEPALSAPPVEPLPTPAPAAERVEPPAIPRVVWPRPEVEPVQKAVLVQSVAAPAPEQIASEPSREAETTTDAEPLVSAEAQAAIANSFEALSVGVAVQNSTMIEDAVREMIRPMLKAWLDDNLPSLVESLVRSEIQRVARGGR